MVKTASMSGDANVVAAGIDSAQPTSHVVSPIIFETIFCREIYVHSW
jgi:hypothetical protein